MLCAEHVASVEDVEIDPLAEIGLELPPGGDNEHVSHEEGVVDSGAEDSDLESIPRVPSDVPVDDVKLLII